MTRWRLLHVTTVPSSLVFLRGQVGYMRAHGADVFAVSSPGAELREFAESQGVSVRAVAMPRRITPLRDLMAVAALHRAMRDVRPDVVHAHTPKGGLLGMLAAWLARVPVRVYHMRGLPMMTATGMRRRLLRTTERIACRLAHSVICVSHSLRDVALSERLCPPAKIRVLLGGSGNGVDASGRFDPARLPADTRSRVRHELGIPADALVVGFVGRVVRDKGVVELADAWREIRAAVPAAHLLVVGPFEAQDPLPAQVEHALRSDPSVHLTGMNWDTPAFYAAMDVVVLPTYREGFPNVPLEAAAMGLPVVATRVAGCVDAVADGVTGTLVPAREPAPIRDAVLAYLADPALRRAHGVAGHDRVRRDFRQEAIWAAVHQEYVRLLESRPATRRVTATAPHVATTGLPR